MTTISLNIEETIKNNFYNIANEMGIKGEKALLFLINKIIENPNIINFDSNKKINLDVLRMGEDSFSSVWNNKEDDIYANLYKNV